MPPDGCAASGRAGSWASLAIQISCEMHLERAVKTLGVTAEIRLSVKSRKQNESARLPSLQPRPQVCRPRPASNDLAADAPAWSPAWAAEDLLRSEAPAPSAPYRSPR